MGKTADFFVSYTSADRAWAEWIAWQLEAEGYSVIVQAWDFRPGRDFVQEMHWVVDQAQRTIAVLSPAYLDSAFGGAEWRAVFAKDPTGERGLLLPVRVEEADPPGLLTTRIYVDLVGKNLADARAALLAAAQDARGKPAAEPAFPGAQQRATVGASTAPRFPGALPPVWNLPFRRNPTFTGREQTLTELAEQLERSAAAVTQAVQGPGGVGKTALAVEYAYRHRFEFDTVWWVRAERPATLVGDYAGLADALELPGAGQADQQLAVAAVRRWLEEHDRWLLVLDNADAPNTPTGLAVPLARLIDLLPQVVHGQVLVTSRDASWEEHAALAELEIFTPDEAVAFLLGRSGSSDQSSAAEVAELLGLLPLALEQAGAYIRETRLSLADYLERLRGYPALTVGKGRPRDRNPSDTVATTWQVSLERVGPTIGAAVLLEVCAFLGPEELPRRLFAQQLDPPAVELHLLANDPFALDTAVAALRRFALVKVDEETLTVHRLLQQVVRDSLDPVSKAARVGVAVRLLDQAFPFGGQFDPGLWPVCARLLPHALVATEHAEQLGVEPLSTAGLLESAADYLHGRARYVDARRLHERALAIREAQLGADHPDTAQGLSNLARVLRAQGNLAAARRLHERALTIREAQLGADHLETAGTLDNLAIVLRAQGDLAAARRLHERALAIREAQLGADDPDTAWTLDNLAGVLRAQGDLAAARRLHERARAVLETRLGADHPATAWSLDALALVLRDQGDLAAARALLERALAILEARRGADHPTTAWTVNNLGLVLRDQGDLAAARRLHERALAICEARLGNDHPDTVWTRRKLATVVAELGDRQQGG